MTEISPQAREQATAAAVQVVQFVEALAAKLKAGKLKFYDALWLAQSVLQMGGTVQPVIAGGAPLQAALASEILDAATGTDATAFEPTRDFLPGLDAAAEEQLLDQLKPILEDILEKQLAKAQTKPGPNA